MLGHICIEISDRSTKAMGSDLLVDCVFTKKFIDFDSTIIGDFQRSAV
jgi:hypothetical protein